MDEDTKALLKNKLEATKELIASQTAVGGKGLAKNAERALLQAEKTGIRVRLNCPVNGRVSVETVLGKRMANPPLTQSNAEPPRRMQSCGKNDAAAADVKPDFAKSFDVNDDRSEEEEEWRMAGKSVASEKEVVALDSSDYSDYSPSESEDEPESPPPPNKKEIHNGSCHW